MTVMPSNSALLFNLLRNPPSAESDSAFANFLFFNIFDTFSVSTPMTLAF